MPLVQVNILEGRTDEQKEALIHELTEACYKAIGAPRETVRVLINEMPKQNWGIGGQSAKKIGR
ncbi:MAG: 4-oxalocrotonate tautomerase family protein [Oceanospirillaceae bacterium]|nr:4-oxalocrotonate tautomerase family protein [Oceanospirillaceae bacterium]